MAPDEQMLRAYRHDAHKMRGRSHGSGAATLAGVSVNEDVPYGADADAAAMSRPSGKPTQVVDNHETHYRLSLVSGDTKYDPETFSLQHYRDELHDLLSVDDAPAMHRAWLGSGVVAAFNEAVFYPYTSLKYHTLIVGALVDNYRNGTTFDDLWLVVGDGDEVRPYRTVFECEEFSLHLTDRDDAPQARVGNRPRRSWSSTWSRLSGPLPIDVDHDKYAMYLDANLRRVRSWSTALQYLEDFRAWEAAR